MSVRVIAVLSLALSVQSGQDLASTVPTQNRAQEIADLLQNLAPGLMERSRRVSIGQSSTEIIERVRARLLLIANESPESRRSVIEALIPVLNDPKKEFDLAEVERWRLAVALLGDLKATEAIDDLVRNVDWTSYESWPHPHPPVRTALVRIGEPAVARLLSALSDSNEYLRREVSEALSEIGEPSVEGLLDILARSAPSSRVGAAQALARIGGARAREAIVLALSVETDEDTKKQLEYAVGYMDHVECLKDSSKCK